MYLQWVFVPIVWLVFAMWVMPAKRLHSVAGRGVLAVGLVLAAGGILSRDVPVAGLLK